MAKKKEVYKVKQLNENKKNRCRQELCANSFAGSG